MTLSLSRRGKTITTRRSAYGAQTASERKQRRKLRVIEAKQNEGTKSSEIERPIASRRRRVKHVRFNPIKSKPKPKSSTKRKKPLPTYSQKVWGDVDSDSEDSSTKSIIPIVLMNELSRVNHHIQRASAKKVCKKDEIEETERLFDDTTDEAVDQNYSPKTNNSDRDEYLYGKRRQSGTEKKHDHEQIKKSSGRNVCKSYDKKSSKRSITTKTSDDLDDVAIECSISESESSFDNASSEVSEPEFSFKTSSEEGSLCDKRSRLVKMKDHKDNQRTKRQNTRSKTTDDVTQSAKSSKEHSSLSKYISPVREKEISDDNASEITDEEIKRIKLKGILGNKERNENLKEGKNVHHSKNDMFKSHPAQKCGIGSAEKKSRAFLNKTSSLRSADRPSTKNKSVKISPLHSPLLGSNIEIKKSSKLNSGGSIMKDNYTQSLSNRKHLFKATFFSENLTKKNQIRETSDEDTDEDIKRIKRKGTPNNTEEEKKSRKSKEIDHRKKGNSMGKSASGFFDSSNMRSSISGFHNSSSKDDAKGKRTPLSFTKVSNEKRKVTPYHALHSLSDRKTKKSSTLAEGERVCRRLDDFFNEGQDTIGEDISDGSLDKNAKSKTLNDEFQNKDITQSIDKKSDDILLFSNNFEYDIPRCDQLDNKGRELTSMEKMPSNDKKKKHKEKRGCGKSMTGLVNNENFDFKSGEDGSRSLPKENDISTSQQASSSKRMNKNERQSSLSLPKKSKNKKTIIESLSEFSPLSSRFDVVCSNTTKKKRDHTANTKNAVIRTTPKGVKDNKNCSKLDDIQDDSSDDEIIDDEIEQLMTEVSRKANSSNSARYDYLATLQQEW